MFRRRPNQRGRRMGVPAAAAPVGPACKPWILFIGNAGLGLERQLLWDQSQRVAKSNSGAMKIVLAWLGKASRRLRKELPPHWMLVFRVWQIVLQPGKQRVRRELPVAEAGRQIPEAFLA